MKIMPSFIDKSICHTADWFNSWGLVQNSTKKNLTDPAKYAATMLVTSIVSKDLVGCILYTTQSWNNKKIPEEKRKFVASLDLMNGIIMVFGQFLIGKVIEAKATPKLFGKFFTGIFKDKHTQKENDMSVKVREKAPYGSDNISRRCELALKECKAELAKNGLDVAKLNRDNVKDICEQIVKEVGKDSKNVKALEAGFGILVSAIATTALTKRTLAPLLSTPLASWFEGKFLKKGKKVKSDSLDDKLLSHTTAPWNQNANGDSFKKVVTK